MISRSARVALNVLTSYGRFGVNLVVMFLLTPYLVQRLGAVDFGLWSLVFSALGFLALLDLGFGTAATKYAAEGRGSGDLLRRNQALSTVGAVYLALSLLAAAAVLGLALLFDRLFEVPAGRQQTALWIVLILGVRLVVVALPLSLFRSVLFGSQRIDLVNAMQVLGTVAYGVGAWLGLRAGGGLVTLAWINLGAMLLEHLLYVVLAFRHVPGLRLSPALVQRSTLREVSSFSAATFMVNVAGLVLLRTDPIIVSFGASLTGVAVYAVALKLAENAHLLVKQFVNVLGPLVAELHAAGDRSKVRQVLVSASRFAVVPAGGITAALAVLGQRAVVLWVGPEFDGAGTVLTVLLLAVTASVPQMVASSVLTMSGEHKAVARAAVLSAVLNLTLSIALIGPLGLVGVALGTLITTLVIDVGYVLNLACRAQQVRYATLLARVYGPVLVAGGLQAAVTWLAAWTWPPGDLLAVVLRAIPGGVLYVIVTAGLFLDTAERDLLFGRLIRRLRRRSTENG